ncbi:MAG: hypothetical protein E6767_16695 [Dysgonomonas sp.]|nr:hypothetical protein [Dysgonomonas sp.]
MTIVALIGTILFALTVILYILLIFGAPLGEYAMGGQHRILPTKNRIITTIALIIQLFGIVVLLQGGGIINTCLSTNVIRIACYVFAVYLSLNVLMNIASKSKKEKMLMAPLSLIVAACYWILALEL